MAFIINDPYAHGGGGVAGEQLGNAFTTAINGLAQQKMQELGQAKQARIFHDMGLDPRLAGLSPEMQNTFLKQYTANNPNFGRIQQPGMGGNDPLADMFQSLGGQRGATAFGPAAQNTYLQHLLGKQGGVANLNPEQQKQMEAQAKPYENQFQSVRKAKELLELIKGGKVAGGWKGRLPIEALNSESQIADKGFQELVSLMEQSLTGRPSVARLQQIQRQKPSLNQKTATQIRLLEDIIRSGENQLKVGSNNPYIKQRLDELNAAFQGNPENQPFQGQNNPQIQPVSAQGATSGRPQQPSQEEGLLGMLGRGAVRGAARVAGAGLGAPGDIAGAALGLGNYLSGGKIPSYGEVREKAPFLPPTSDDIAKGIDSFTNGYTAPQGGGEEALDEILGLAGSMFVPGKAAKYIGKGLAKAGASAGTLAKANKVLLPFSGDISKGRALGTALGTYGAGELAEGLGADPLAKAVTKIAFMTLAGTKGGRKQIQEIEKSAFKNAEDGFASLNQSVKPTEKQFNNIKKSVENANVPQKESLNKIIDDDLKSFADHPRGMPVNDLINKRKALRARQRYAYEETVSNQKEYTPKDHWPYLQKMEEAVTEAIKRAGEKRPEALRSLEVGEDITKGLKATNRVSRFLKEWAEDHGHVRSSFVKQILQVGAGAIAQGLGKITDTAIFFKQNPVAKEHYINMMKAAAANNSVAFAQHLAKLDKVASQFEKK